MTVTKARRLTQDRSSEVTKKTAIV